MNYCNFWCLQVADEANRKKAEEAEKARKRQEDLEKEIRTQQEYDALNGLPPYLHSLFTPPVATPVVDDRAIEIVPEAGSDFVNILIGNPTI